MKTIRVTAPKPHGRSIVGRLPPWLGPCPMGVLFLSTAIVSGQAVREAWVRCYSYEGSGSDDLARKIVTDADGNVIVAGDTDDEGRTARDMLIIKYSGAGVPVWTNRYNGPGNGYDSAAAVAPDSSGNVVVTGSSAGAGGRSDYATIKYSGAGAPLWTNRYTGPGNFDDYATAVAVDSSGNVFVTGYSARSNSFPYNYDYATIAYSRAGVALWTNRYDGPGNSEDRARAVAVDFSGNVFVTGYSALTNAYPYYDYDYSTIAYSGAGVALWTNRYDGPGNFDDFANAVAVDASGNVFVTGSSTGMGSSGTSYEDYATIAYTGAGVPLWTNRYSGPENFVGVSNTDVATAVAVDASGNVVVTGNSVGSGGYSDYATIKYSGAGAPLWTNRYNGPGNNSDFAAAVAVDASGNVFVTGSSFGRGPFPDSGLSSDYATIAYSGTGALLWINRYDGPSIFDQAAAMAVDASGNVFVTGSSAGSGGHRDYATIAYSGAGAPLWINRYTGSGNFDDYAAAVAVDASGNVFVTGYSIGAEGHFDYATIAYSAAGLPLWTNRYNGPGNTNDQAIALAVDSSGNVFVTGSSAGSGGYSDYATIAYSGAGTPLWINRYNGPGNYIDTATAVAVNSGGNVFVTGYSYANESSYDYATIAYSGAGTPLWIKRYNGSANSSDVANAIAVDSSGNVFVTGYSYDSGGHSDYATIAYSAAGTPLWINRYNGPGNGEDYANAVVVDSSGAVFVTGHSVRSNTYPYNYDYATIAYSGAGAPLWTNRYNGPANDDDIATAVAVDSSGNVFVTGYSATTNGYPYNYDYATIAYSGAGVPLWTNRYNGPGNTNDEATAVAADSSGNVFVTGYSYGSGSSRDYATIAYSGAGVPLWTNHYNGPASGDDHPLTKSCLAIGPDGAVYVAGASDGNYTARTAYDYAIVKYVMPRLNIAHGPASSVKVAWPLSYADYILQCSTNLSATSWGTDVTMPMTNDTSKFILVDPPARQKFYRLREP